MSPLPEVLILTARELRRTFRSAKGALLAALALCGGAATSLLLAKLERLQSQALPKGVGDAAPLREAFFRQLYNDDVAHQLASCPYGMWLMFVGTLWLCPLLVALMGFDAVSGELSQRTVRYWSVRTRRSSYVVAKFLGAWASVLSVILAVHASLWITNIILGHVPLSVVLRWGLWSFAGSIPIVGAWCGIAILVGSQFRTPMLSLLAICFAFFALWVLRLSGGFAGASWLVYAYPNAFDVLLLSPNSATVGLGWLGALCIAGAAVLGSVFLYRLRDL